jgi:magnesium chelatase family protein
MTGEELREMPMDREARRLLSHHHAKHCLSGRGHDRVLRLARTVADLEGCPEVAVQHMAVALHLRNPEAEP